MGCANRRRKEPREQQRLNAEVDRILEEEKRQTVEALTRRANAIRKGRKLP